MIEDSRFYIKPKPDLKIWRYVSLKKLEDLLDHKSLYLCRADIFNDPFEGSIPLKEAEHRKNQFEDYQAFSEYTKNFKRQVYLNCWHINAAESDAMWKLYLKDFKGVAIQSNVERLSNAINTINSNSWPSHLSQSDREIGISKVRYIDYDKDIFHSKEEYPVIDLNMTTPFIHKRKEFIHENELRLMLTDNSNSIFDSEMNPKGIKIKIDIHSLIDAIILPPKQNDSLKKEIESIIEKSDINLKLRSSKMTQKAIF